MALTFDTATYTIESTASINDLPAFHAACRDWEDSEQGAIHPVTHSWKALDLGSGGFFYQADLLSPWVLKFPNAGNYAISGNLNATITPVAGVYVERKTSAAYITTSVGGSGPTAESIALATVAALQGTRIPVNAVEGAWPTETLIKAALLAAPLGPRTLAAHLQSIAAVLLGEQAGAGTSRVTYTDGAVSVAADVPLPGVVGNRTNVGISGV